MKTKSTRKRLLAVLAAIALASVLFAGCGNKQQAQEQPKADTTEVAAVSEAAEEQVDVSEAQPEEETSAEAEVPEETTEAEATDEQSGTDETTGQYATLDVDSMSFEWTDDTRLVLFRRTDSWLIAKDSDGNISAMTLLLAVEDYHDDDINTLKSQIRGLPYMIEENMQARIQNAVNIEFSDNYLTMYNTSSEENHEYWALWMKAIYQDSAVKYEMFLSEEDEALHVRKMDGEEVLEVYDTETSLKLAQKIIKDLLPFVTIE